MLGAATSGDAVARFSKFSLFGFGKSDAVTRVLTEDLLITKHLGYRKHRRNPHAFSPELATVIHGSPRLYRSGDLPDLPPLKWSSLKYGFDRGGWGRWQGNDTRQTRS